MFIFSLCIISSRLASISFASAWMSFTHCSISDVCADSRRRLRGVDLGVERLAVGVGLVEETIFKILHHRHLNNYANYNYSCEQKTNTHSRFLLYLRGKCLDLYKTASSISLTGAGSCSVQDFDQDDQHRSYRDCTVNNFRLRNGNPLLGRGKVIGVWSGCAPACVDATLNYTLLSCHCTMYILSYCLYRQSLQHRPFFCNMQRILLFSAVNLMLYQ